MTTPLTMKHTREFNNKHPILTIKILPKTITQISIFPRPRPKNSLAYHIHLSNLLATASLHSDSISWSVVYTKSQISRLLESAFVLKFIHI